MAVNQNFSRELEAAKQAAQRLAEIRELERTAARLPELQQKSDLQRRQQEAGVSLDEAQRRAAETLQNAKPKIQDARRRFENGLAECLAALADIQPTQDEIEAAASRLWNAVSAEASLASANGDSGGFWGRPYGVNAATVNSEFGRYWQQIGGNSPDLDFVDGEPDRVSKAILVAAQARVYQTRNGAKSFYKYR